jgi:hypothetical protein
VVPQGFFAIIMPHSEMSGGNRALFIGRNRLSFQNSDSSCGRDALHFDCNGDLPPNDIWIYRQTQTVMYGTETGKSNQSDALLLSS